ncbi:MAG: NUDIX hydrolase [Pseudomonadota bacterium]
MSQKRSIAPTVPAATVLLLRDAPDGLEVFMVVRHHQIDFASGALVFPGGKADPQDFEPELRELAIGGTDDDDLFGAQVAALREAFEECGVLLARRLGEDRLIDGERLASLQTYREPINNGELGFAQFLREQHLVLDCGALGHFAHWITPEMMPKRFDTHFFVASAPPDQLAVHDGYESVDSVWIRPADAIGDAESGQRTIIFPTLRNIHALDRATTVAEAFDQLPAKPVPVLPWMEKRDDGQYLCIPPEAGYDISEEKMPERRA